MITEAIQIPAADVRRLLGAASGDAALLYIYMQSGNRPETALEALRFTQARYSCAAATLRQLGLWPEEKVNHIAPGERPQYTETDVLEAMEQDVDFRSLYGEIQRQLGRSMNTEEMKIILGFVRYLGMGADVISVLVSYCKDRARAKGRRAPTLRAIEKEGYFWAERGIDTVEEAAAYIQTQNVRNSRLQKLLHVLQIHGRPLTAAEDRYAQSWLDMGFEDGVIDMAYERTCLNTGGLRWAYMNKILQRWHRDNLHTLEAIQKHDRKDMPKGASGELSQSDLENIQRILREG